MEDHGSRIDYLVPNRGAQWDFTTTIRIDEDCCLRSVLLLKVGWKLSRNGTTQDRFASDNEMRAELGERLFSFMVSDGVTHPDDSATGPGNIPAVVQSRVRVYHPTRLLGCAGAARLIGVTVSTCSARVEGGISPPNPITPDLPILSHNTKTSDAQSEVQTLSRKCKAQDRRPVSAVWVIRPAGRGGGRQVPCRVLEFKDVVRGNFTRAGAQPLGRRSPRAEPSGGYRGHCPRASGGA